MEATANFKLQTSNSLKMRKLLIVALLCPFLSMCQPISLKGKVLNESGDPVAFATVTVTRTGAAFACDARGRFLVSPLAVGDTLLFSAVGYNTQAEVFDLALMGRELTVTLNRKTALLDEAVIIAYGTTTRRLSTSTITKVSASEIASQPVSNPLSALEGRVPGLLITQTSGVPGSGYTVELRGRTSIAQASDPLYIIDGVPYAPGNSSLSSGISSALPNSNASPFSSINPLDIEIYGSRGANGVILITTKKGTAGKPRLSATAYSGWSRVGRTMPLLNTQQYLQMRKEAFVNDGQIPTASRAYDLLLFDSSRYTDFTDYFTGGTARNTSLNASLSGGSPSTRFILNGGYDRQTTVFPGDLYNQRLSLHTGFHHQTPGERLSLHFSASYSWEDNHLNSTDLTRFITLPPNYFDFFDSTGGLVWQYRGLDFDNPMSYIRMPYQLTTGNLLSSLSLDYRLLKGLSLKADLGYGRVDSRELIRFPKAAQSPSGFSNATFGDSRFTSYSFEPQLLYGARWGKHHADAVAGASVQGTTTAMQRITGFNYTSDALLGSIGAATVISGKSGTVLPYRYAALFGRVRYDFDEKYLLSLSARRDGSSRFGASKQWAGFGSVGAGWLFTREAFAKNWHFLSFGKLRASYGSTGNDKIGDYKYLSTWSAGIPYGSSGTLVPTALYNPDYGWEVNRKLELAADLGMLSDRVLLTVNYYRSRSSNQLVQYALPSQTGFTSVISNFPALVENKGWELELTTRAGRTEGFLWEVAANITLPKNKLVSFPGIENTSYARLVVGQPLSVYGGYHFLGIDPATGLYSFEGKNGTAVTRPSFTDDWKADLGNLEPQYYGGIRNRFSYRGFSLDIFVDFRKQPGLNYLAQLATRMPGSLVNLPKEVLNHWTKPGDVALFPRYTQSTAYFYSFSALNNSDARYGDASFLRLRSLRMAYELSPQLLQRLKLGGLTFFFEGQNLKTFTTYRGLDPESQNILRLPPLQTLAAGISIIL
jgi:TonB-linked SusC/RagA family outer membrane protein